MQALEVNYLGLALKNPLIVSSSGLTSTAERIVSLERAGAGAVVLKSLFEEQINMEVASADYYNDYPEAHDYLSEYTRQHSLTQHMELISEAKKKTDIPIIASVCCTTAGEWIDFAEKLQDAGADALELNIYLLPLGKDTTTADVERAYLEIVDRVCRAVTIPVSVKLGQQFTNIPATVEALFYRKAKGVVLFNRYYDPDIDVDNLTMTGAPVFSSPSEFRTVLRWLAICSALVPNMQYAASTGIHDGKTAVKALLGGATGVEICSTIYQNGMGIIPHILQTLETWMVKHGYTRVEDFIGKMNYAGLKDPAAYERTQFMRYFSSLEK